MLRQGYRRHPLELRSAFRELYTRLRYAGIRGGRTPKTVGFLVIFRLRSRCAAVAAFKRRGGCGDVSMVRIRLVRFALPRLGLGGSKSGVSCSPLVCRVRGTIENVRASASRPEAVSIVLRGRAWEGKREDGEEDTRAACRRPNESVGAKGGGRHQEPDPFLKILHDADDGEGTCRKNRSRKSDVT